MKEHCCIFSIFGATGDLANRKLLPALYYLEHEKHLKDKFSILALARKEKTNEEYRKESYESIRKFSRIKINDDILNKLVSRIYYKQLDFFKSEDYEMLKKFIESISEEKCSHCERIFYLAVPPSIFGTIANNLKNFRLAERQHEHMPYNRVMFEKPFGHDVNSAKDLNRQITNVFHEEEIYRIDHYMAKELVQNLLVLRFANSIFEPLWNKKYIDHIQITVAETLGVGGRGDYYDKAGALKDVMQNHMMQLLTLVAMEEPKSFGIEDVRDKKVKVLKSISKFSKKNISKVFVKGQYSEGFINGKKVNAYNTEPEVSSNSKTETYAALKLEINNNMWKGVPFYLRTGKRLQERSAEIVIAYKKVPFGLFSNLNLEKNMMVIRVQPYEGITLNFNAKVPGNKLIIDNVNMDFCHECKFGPNSPEAYERLLYDVMIGDQTLFTRWDEVEHAWKLIDNLTESSKDEQIFLYEAGSFGPAEADKLIENDGRRWVVPQKPSYADLLDKQNSL